MGAHACEAGDSASVGSVSFFPSKLPTNQRVDVRWSSDEWLKVRHGLTVHGNDDMPTIRAGTWCIEHIWCCFMLMGLARATENGSTDRITDPKSVLDTTKEVRQQT
jgi:hypothetical protein